jgi:hypothetical protein
MVAMKVDISIKINRSKDILRSRCRVDINGETIFDNFSKIDPYGISGSSGSTRKISKEERRIIQAAVRAWLKSDDVVLKKLPIKSKSPGFSFG